MPYLIILRVAVVLLGICYILALQRARQLSSVGWSELVFRLDPVRMTELKLLSRYTRSNMQSGTVEFWHMYKEIGGSEGVRRMRHNATTLIMLAAYTETWSPGVSVEVVRQMRADGFRLKRAAWKIYAVSFGAGPKLWGTVPLLELSKAYCGMVSKLLGLYAVTHVAKYPELSAACSNW